MTDIPAIEIEVHSQFLEEHEVEGKQKYAFSYHIRIYNRSEQQVQLLNRYWLITDANGKQSEVQGPGVVGQQPYINPGKSYQYTSGALLETPVGTMQGHYEMQCADSSIFKAPIPVFSLAIPSIIN